ncbi:MAG: EscU/YscU/HrcU family type III secretion system export apparatus switch protein [Oxalobacteraceae bacterium]|jgi:type III secretion system FlhB-like substrate exporter|nr:EscU/YscU/HrcU family type III secretion system export apparatus switch protein [Oxalobacteraceae bacterium]
MNRQPPPDLHNVHVGPTSQTPGTDNALALAIMEEATRRGTEIGSDPELLAALSGIGGEEQIPRELYVAIAAVLGWVDGLK